MILATSYSESYSFMYLPQRAGRPPVCAFPCKLRIAHGPVPTHNFHSSSRCTPRFYMNVPLRSFTMQPTTTTSSTTESTMASVYGISKTAFIRTRIVPANDNDTINDNKCAICWDQYENDHPAVRVLPCNHVFGRECLLEVIDTSSTGDLCMICRTPLFRPSFWKLLEQLTTGLLVALVHVMMFLYHKIRHLYSKLPRWLRALIRGLYLFSCRRDAYGWVNMALCRFTNLPERNPTLETRYALMSVCSPQYLYDAYICFKVVMKGGPIRSRLFTRSADLCGYDNVTNCSIHVLLTLFMIPIVWSMFVRGNLRKEDRSLFISAVFMTFLLNNVSNIWIIACTLFGLDASEQWFGQALLLWVHLDYFRAPSDMGKQTATEH